MGVWVHSGSSILLVIVSDAMYVFKINLLIIFYYTSIVQHAIWSSETSSSSFMVQIVFIILDIFFFPFKAENYPFIVCKQLGWDFDGTDIKCVDYF